MTDTTSRLAQARGATAEREREKRCLSAESLTVSIRDATHQEEATIRRVVTPELSYDHDARTVTIAGRGLSLREEARVVGEEALLITLAARYKRGKGAIQQRYRYLVFGNAEEREGKGALYAVRLPMGAWAPEDPDTALAWLGRGGLQQGDFVLLSRKRLPTRAAEVPRPAQQPFWQRAKASLQRFVSETLGEGTSQPDAWEARIGRHRPRAGRLFAFEDRTYFLAERPTVIDHPEHAALQVPEGLYEVVEDRATAYWREAID